MRASGATVELRGDIPRDIADTLDAVSLAGCRSRMSLVTEILHDWASHKRREAMLVLNLSHDNPPALDAGRSAAEGKG